MAASDYPKGSILNPFTESEYREMAQANTWHGGWVTESSDDRTYYTQGGVQHNYMGSKQHPYTNDIFAELRLNSMWIGGWVLHTDDSLRYYTASLIWYSPYHNDDLWGSEAYPVSSDIYVEMCRLSLWEGGWVESTDATYYVGYPTLDGGPSGDGCGCGCGCEGSGSGSGEEGSDPYSGGCDEGCGSDDQITPGSRVVGSNEDGKIIIEWTSRPKFSFIVQLDPDNRNYYGNGIPYREFTYEMGPNNFLATWDGDHNVMVSGKLEYTQYVLEYDALCQNIVREYYDNKTIEIDFDTIQI